MKSSFYHFSLNSSRPEFYRELLEFLGFEIVVEYADGFGMSDGSVSIWVFRVGAKYAKRAFHRKGIGLNHVAFRVEDARHVDEFYREFLQKRGILALYGGPKEYPEYHDGYYAVYFEDPDRMKIEVVSGGAGR